MTDDLPDIAQQIAHFESRLRLDPQSRVFLPLADLYRRSGELEHARDLLERGLEAHPRFVAARAALGLVQVQLGQTDAARASLDQVLGVDPDNVLALEVLLDEAADRGDWEGVRDLASRMLRLKPEDPSVAEALQGARARLEGEPTAATTVVATSADDDAATAAPEAEAGAAADYRAFETPTLAELYLRQGHVDKARRIVERILGADPDREDALELMARIEAPDGATPEAADEPDAAAEAQDGGEARTPAPDDGEAARPETPPGAGQRSTGTSRGAAGDTRDLDRFRAWLDTARADS
ncbi:tetratricopeptide repeat protein [bacterium]|nr:tetratricopeptide repeat protein [bacterium]